MKHSGKFYVPSEDCLPSDLRSSVYARGVAADAAMAYADMPREFARVNPEYCTYCKRCLKACFYDGMQDDDAKVWVQQDNCGGCGGCLSVCPVPGAIDIMIRH